MLALEYRIIEVTSVYVEVLKSPKRAIPIHCLLFLQRAIQQASTAPYRLCVHILDNNTVNQPHIIIMTRTNAPRASESERKERRRAANRKSARKSRFRENVLLDELQKTVTDLGKHNHTLKSENNTFKEEIAALQSLLACHVKTQQLVSSFEAWIPLLFLLLVDCRSSAPCL